MMAETIKIDGLRELGEAMRKLSSNVANRAARGATASAATLVRSARRPVSGAASRATARRPAGDSATAPPPMTRHGRSVMRRQMG